MSAESNSATADSPARIIVLDRDGVINHDSDDYIKSAEEWIPIAGSLAAIARLHQLGYRVVIATNQSGVARGLYSLEQLEAIHTRLTEAVAEAGGRIDGIYYCPHGPQDGCDCRKPRPGLLRQIEANLDISLNGCDYVGDSLRDLQAARAVGARPVLVKTGYGEDTLAALPDEYRSVPVYDDLAGFVADLEACN